MLMFCFVVGMVWYSWCMKSMSKNNFSCFLFIVLFVLYIVQIYLLINEHGHLLLMNMATFRQIGMAETFGLILCYSVKHSDIFHQPSNFVINLLFIVINSLLFSAIFASSHHINCRFLTDADPKLIKQQYF